MIFHLCFCRCRRKILSVILATIIALLTQKSTQNVHAINIKGANEVSITGYRDEYCNSQHQQDLKHDRASEFHFQRFQSPGTIKNALSLKYNAFRKAPFKWYKCKDGRKGFVSCTKLVGDWVLAESEQVAVKCTVEEVLRAYLSGHLQQKWNSKQVLDCNFECKTLPVKKELDENEKNKAHTMSRILFGQNQKSLLQTKKTISPSTSESSTKLKEGKYYRQDLVLRSQRIIRSHTGIMMYSQIITIDKIGKDNYSVLVCLDPEQQKEKESTTKPFNALSVYIGLEQNGDNVDIYAAGVMQVNRKVVPNLFVFDASGIAGSMAGKGTLWLAGFFDSKLST